MNVSGISLENWSKLLPVSKQAISKQIGHKLKAYIQKHIYYQIYPSSSGFRKEQVRQNLNRLLERLKTLNLQPKGRGRKPFLNLDLLRSFTGAKGNSPIEILKDFICKIRNICLSEIDKLFIRPLKIVKIRRSLSEIKEALTRFEKQRGTHFEPEELRNWG